MRISDQTLLAHLLGGLEAEQDELIRTAIADDPTLAQRLSELKRWLSPLPPPGATLANPTDSLAGDSLAGDSLAGDSLAGDSLAGDSLAGDSLDAPPSNLAERTLAAIWALESNHPQPSDEPPSAAKPSEAAAAARRRRFAARPIQEQQAGPTGLWRSPDLLALAVAAVVMLGLLLPNLQSARELARSASCGDHLRQLGMALGAFADKNARRQIPAIDPVGPMSFAGVYASQLQSHQLLDDAAWLFCPGQPASHWWGGRRPPTIEQLTSASDNELQQLQRIAGGSYAYNLGVWKAPHYQPIRLQGRSYFAVLGDRPLTPDTAQLTWRWHGDQVANVLFEDGHIRRVRLDHHFQLPDHPFRNELGEAWAGLSEHDACLGISSAPPLPPRIRHHWLRTGRNNRSHPTLGPHSPAHFGDETPSHPTLDR